MSDYITDNAYAHDRECSTCLYKSHERNKFQQAVLSVICDFICMENNNNIPISLVCIERIGWESLWNIISVSCTAQSCMLANAVVGMVQSGVL